jgi:hypothetical protein
MLRYQSESGASESDLVIRVTDTATMAIRATDTAMAIIRTDTIARIGTMAIPRALRTTDITTGTTGIEFTVTTVIIATITIKVI